MWIVSSLSKIFLGKKKTMPWLKHCELLPNDNYHQIITFKEKSSNFNFRMDSNKIYMLIGKLLSLVSLVSILVISKLLTVNIHLLFPIY